MRIPGRLPIWPPQSGSSQSAAGASLGLSRRAAIVAASTAAIFGNGAQHAWVAMASDISQIDSPRFKFASTSPVWTPEAVVTNRAVQSTYNPKFVAYFARILLNFDRASQVWWQDQTPRPFVAGPTLATSPELLQKQADDFQRLQASISLGLRAFQSRDGVNRLFELLSDRFGGTEAGDRQLALLFSLMGDLQARALHPPHLCMHLLYIMHASCHAHVPHRPCLQPTASIARLVGATDDARVAQFAIEDGGCGYEAGQPPLVSVTAGAASDFNSATGRAQLSPSGQLLRLDVLDGGSGYMKPPRVSISPPARGGRRAVAQAVLRDGVVEAVIITDSGEGYSVADEPLLVRVAPPGITDGADTEVLPETKPKLKRFQGYSAPGNGIYSARYTTTAEAGVRPDPPGKLPSSCLASAPAPAPAPAPAFTPALASIAASYLTEPFPPATCNLHQAQRR